MDFAGVGWLSFDCYGTLIDWESGILGALRPILRRHGVRAENSALLATYARLERDLETGPYRPYREVLRRVMDGIGMELGLRLPAHEREALAESLGRWEAFDDTGPSLAAMKRRFRLAVISNVDDDLFAVTAAKLGVKLDAFVSAQQCRSYKPSLNNFRVALERMGSEPHEVVHVAESLYHDISPARVLGIRSIWINRGRGSPGASGTALAVPDLELPDLASLAAVVEASSTR